MIAPHDPGAAYEESFGDIKVLRFPYFFPTRLQRLCNGLGILPNMRKSILAKLQVPFLFLCEYRFIKRVLKKEKPDLVHSHWAIPQGLCAAAALPKSIPRFLTIHSSDLHTLRRLYFGPALMKYIIKGVKATFLVSTYLQALLREMDIDSSSEMKVLPMGVDDAFYRQWETQEDEPFHRLLYIGKLIEVKGVDVLIEAMASAVKQLPKLGLRIIGDGPQRGRLEQKAESLGLLNGRITFMGQLPHHRLPDQLQQADAVVVPSIITKRGETEGMPVVILEAMASGLPVIVSDVGGLKEVVRDGINGFLFPHSKSDRLSRAIERLYEPAVLSHLKQGARNSGKNFNWTTIAAGYRAVFES